MYHTRLSRIVSRYVYIPRENFTCVRDGRSVFHLIFRKCQKNSFGAQRRKKTGTHFGARDSNRIIRKIDISLRSAQNRDDLTS